jgi:hypothetical protein
MFQQGLKPKTQMIVLFLGIVFTVAYVRRGFKMIPIDDTWKKMWLWESEYPVYCDIREGGLYFPEYETNRELLPLDPRCTVKWYHEPQHKYTDHVWNHRGAVAVGLVFAGNVPVVCAQSSNNMRAAMQTRHFIAECVPDDLPAMLHTMCGALGNFTGVYNQGIEIHCNNSLLTNVTEIEWINRFDPKKRNKLLKVWDQVKDYGYSAKETFVNGFIKREFVYRTLSEVYGTYEAVKPRLIQGGRDAIKVAHGYWFYNVSKALSASWNRTTDIWYASGATLEDFTAWANDAKQRWGEAAVFYYTDFSNYDATQNIHLIKEETKWLRSLGFNATHELAEKFLESLEFTKGAVYSAGEKLLNYTVEGRRRSGDFLTSSGNTRRTASFVLSFLNMFGEFSQHQTDLEHGNFSMAVLGDDLFMVVPRWLDEKMKLAMNTSSVLVEELKKAKTGVESAMLSHWNESQFKETSMEVLETTWDKIVNDTGDIAKALKDYASMWGMRLKVGTAHDWFSGEFCSGKFYPVNGSLWFGLKPGRILSKVGWFVNKTGVKADEYQNYLKGTLISLYPRAKFVPFLRKYIDVAMETLEGIEAKYFWEDRYKIKAAEEVEIPEADVETWAAFSSFYNLTEEHERIFEEQLRYAVVDGVAMLQSDVYEALVEREKDQELK